MTSASIDDVSVPVDPRELIDQLGADKKTGPVSEKIDTVGEFIAQKHNGLAALAQDDVASGAVGLDTRVQHVFARFGGANAAQMQWRVYTCEALRRLVAQGALLRSAASEAVCVSVNEHVSLGGNTERFECKQGDKRIDVWIFFSIGVQVAGAHSLLCGSLECQQQAVTLPCVTWIDAAKTECFVSGPKHAFTE